MIRWLAPRGAGFIGLNPLHALAPADPARASPYSASSRHFLNVLYIVGARTCPSFGSAPPRSARVDEPRFRARLRELRAAPLVDYRGRGRHQARDPRALVPANFAIGISALGTERARCVPRASWRRAGRLLQLHARFDALDAHLCATHGTASGWLSWPAEFQRSARAARRQRFAARARRARSSSISYLQWLAHEQLADAQALARDLGMPIGLYGDYAVGTHPSGSETWVDQTGYRLGAEIGAPPDPLALKGQGWGLPPPDPVVMESRAPGGIRRA